MSRAPALDADPDAVADAIARAYAGADPSAAARAALVRAAFCARFRPALRAALVERGLLGRAAEIGDAAAVRSLLEARAHGEGEPERALEGAWVGRHRRAYGALRARGFAMQVSEEARVAAKLSTALSRYAPGDDALRALRLIARLARNRPELARELASRGILELAAELGEAEAVRMLAETRQHGPDRLERAANAAAIARRGRALQALLDAGASGAGARALWPQFFAGGGEEEEERPEGARAGWADAFDAALAASSLAGIGGPRRPARDP